MRVNQTSRKAGQVYRLTWVEVCCTSLDVPTPLTDFEQEARQEKARKSNDSNRNQSNTHESHHGFILIPN